MLHQLRTLTLSAVASILLYSPSSASLENPMIRIDEEGATLVKTSMPLLFEAGRNKASAFVSRVQAMTLDVEALTGAKEPTRTRHHVPKKSVLKSFNSTSNELRLRREILLIQQQLEQILEDNLTMDYHRRFYEELKREFTNFGYFTRETTKKQIVRDWHFNFVFSPLEIPIVEAIRSDFEPEMVWLKPFPPRPPEGIYLRTPSAEAIGLALQNGEVLRTFNFSKKWQRFDRGLQLRRLEKERDHLQALCLALQSAAHSEALATLHVELEALGVFKYLPGLKS